MGNPEQDRRLHGGPAVPLKNPHLVASSVAVLLIFILVIAGELSAGWIENRYVHVLAPYNFLQKNQGVAMQQAAFLQEDLLPIYGSSELNWPDPFHSNRIFRMYPTGFTVFPVGEDGSEPLNILQKLAAVGSGLRGKKVALSLSPGFFLETMMPADAYAGNLSPLQANAFAYSSDLTWELKGAVARRMLDYPVTLRNDRLLKFALKRIADGSFSNRLLYYAILPLGELETFMLSLQDHMSTVAFISQQGNLDTTIVKETRAIKWASLLSHSQARHLANSNNNPFGVDNGQWKEFGAIWLLKKNSLDDEQFVKTMSASTAWTDLDLLLSELNELGSQPIILSMPFAGAYFDYMGVSRAARQKFYDRLEARSKSYGVPVVDFEDHDEDKTFFINFGSHLSSVGWVYYSRELEAFYQNSSPSEFVTPASLTR